MTTSTHSYRGYKLVLHRESNDHYQVTIFDPNGKRVASTGTHLEQQVLLLRRLDTSNTFSHNAAPPEVCDIQGDPANEARWLTDGISVIVGFVSKARRRASFSREDAIHLVGEMQSTGHGKAAREQLRDRQKGRNRQDEADPRFSFHVVLPHRVPRTGGPLTLARSSRGQKLPLPEEGI